MPTSLPPLNKIGSAHYPQTKVQKRDEPGLLPVNPADEEIATAKPRMPSTHWYAGQRLLHANPPQGRPWTNRIQEAKHPPIKTESRSQAQSTYKPPNHVETFKKPQNIRLRRTLPSTQGCNADTPSVGVYRSPLAAETSAHIGDDRIYRPGGDHAPIGDVNGDGDMTRNGAARQGHGQSSQSLRTAPNKPQVMDCG